MKIFVILLLGLFRVVIGHPYFNRPLFDLQNDWPSEHLLLAMGPREYHNSTVQLPQYRINTEEPEPYHLLEISGKRGKRETTDKDADIDAEWNSSYDSSEESDEASNESDENESNENEDEVNDSTREDNLQDYEDEKEEDEDEESDDEKDEEEASDENDNETANEEDDSNEYEGEVFDAYVDDIRPMRKVGRKGKYIYIDINEGEDANEENDDDEDALVYIPYGKHAGEFVEEKKLLNGKFCNEMHDDDDDKTVEDNGENRDNAKHHVDTDISANEDNDEDVENIEWDNDNEYTYEPNNKHRKVSREIPAMKRLKRVSARTFTSNINHRSPTALQLEQVKKRQHYKTFSKMIPSNYKIPISARKMTLSQSAISRISEKSANSKEDRAPNKVPFRNPIRQSENL